MTKKSYELFSKNLKYYMNFYNKDRNDICKDLDFKYTTVREWCNGTAFPRIDKLEKLANYFHISTSDLLNEPNDSILNSNTRNIITLQNHIRKLSENKSQEKLLINCTMINEEHCEIINNQVEYYIDKENEIKYK